MTLSAEPAVPDGGPQGLLPSWEPLGLALEAYWRGEHEAEAEVYCEDGRLESLPATALFRPWGFPPAEQSALAAARGRVLDLGAGAGAHCLELGRRGHGVVAVELDPRSARVMQERGIDDVRCGNLLDPSSPSPIEDERFDTVLLMMNGPGLAGTLKGLPRLLQVCQQHLGPGGSILLDACDLRRTDHPQEQALIQRRRQQGRYFGEVRYQLAFEGQAGRPYEWLFVDQHELRRQARACGLRSQLLYEGEDGSFAARLT